MPVDRATSSGCAGSGPRVIKAKAAKPPIDPADPADLVRYSRAGDDFHILWTARKALQLLSGKDGLVALSVEGISEAEGTGALASEDAGLRVVDTTEYYGNQTLDKASSVVYCQFKYSTLHAETKCTSSDITDTLSEFAKRFSGLTAEFGGKVVQKKVRFRFITNRPISEDLIGAVQSVRSAASPKTKKESKALKQLLKATGLAGSKLREFMQALELVGDEGSRSEQSSALQLEAGTLHAHMDSHAVLQMKALVQSKMMPEAKNNKTINKAGVLQALGVVERQLFPAPPRFEPTVSHIPHEQEAEIARVVISATAPVVISAAGGVGKSVLATRLPSLMPPGSHAVVFDGFAAGGYRAPTDPRHQHSHGLVHIANSLAAAGLCDVLLPSAAPDHAYIGALRRRLAQAAIALRSRTPTALLLIVLDAADNSVMAANLRGERAFAPDLLAESPPEGCRIVALARGHRLNLLKLSSDVLRVELKPFTPTESALHLRRKFAAASDVEVRRFHKYTDANPRVQANAISSAADLPALLSDLGPAISTVEKLINDQLDKAFEKVEKEQGASGQELQKVCRALAVLPPLVPVNTLALAAGVAEDAVKSFASDFGQGRPLIVYRGSIQFRDEPVETWFQEKFASTKQQVKRIVASLRAKAADNGYIAGAFPQLLFASDQYSELLSLALTGAKFRSRDPVEQRTIAIRRVKYALRAAIARRRLADVAKLMLRAAEESAIDDRQAGFLMDNGDLVGILAGSDRVFEFVFRRRAWQLSDTGLAGCAFMLASDVSTREEAGRFHQLAMQWLWDWAASKDPARRELSYARIAEYATTIFRLKGGQAAGKFLGQWTSPRVSLEAGRLLTRMLLQKGERKDVADLLGASRSNVHLELAIIAERHRAYVPSDPKDVRHALAQLLRIPVKQIYGENDDKKLYCGPIADLAEAAVISKCPSSKVRKLLARLTPPHRRVLGHWEGASRDAILRVAALKAVLEGRELALADVTPSSLQNLGKDKDSAKQQEEQEFNRTYGALIPWYRLRAKVLCRLVSKMAWKSAESRAIAESRFDSSWYSDDREKIGVVNEIPLLWADSIAHLGLRTGKSFKPLRAWLDAHDKVFIPTWTDLARKTAFLGIHDTALYFAKRAKLLSTESHSDARSTADSFSAIARAVLPISRDEAAEYFRQALEHLDRLGDDIYDRLFCLAGLAERAGESGKAFPEDAYRLSRATELLEAHNDHKFPWGDAAHSIALLCGSSAFAIASRWHDRHKTSLSRSLNPMVTALVKHRRLSPAVAACLHVFPGWWNLRDGADPFFEGAADRVQRQAILDVLIADCEFEAANDRDWKALQEIAKKYGLSSKRLTERLSIPRVASESDSGALAKSLAWKAKGQPWSRIFHGCEFLTPRGIDAAMVRVGQTNGYRPWGEVYSQMRKRIAPSGRVAHIKSLSECAFEVWQAIDAIDGAAKAWPDSEAVRAAVTASVRHLVAEQGLGLARGRGISRKDFDRCVVLSGLSAQDVLVHIVSAMGDNADQINSASWFYMAVECARISLSPQDSLSVLRCALDQLEPLYKPEDGDGPWQRTKLLPPPKQAESIAGFVFSMLASPNAEERWRAAHSVRRFCMFGNAEVIARLVNLLDAPDPGAFSDARLPFYTWNGRLFLLIALARAAEESPTAVKPHIRTLVEWALRREPHVLIREFAAKAALSLARIFPGTLPAKTASALQLINVSPFPEAGPKAGTRVGWVSEDWKSMGFGYDVDRYWLGPLAEAFNLNGKVVAKGLHHWIRNQWNVKHTGHWKDDPRASRGYFSDGGSTSADHGGLPSSDRYSFYLAYHAMFCAAGDLLQKYPPAIPERKWEGARWPTWLKGHLLTRDDGRWISDRRDFEPVAVDRWERLPKKAQADGKDWRWSILGADFDEIIGVADARLRKLTVWARSERAEYSKKQSVSVSSALVSTSTSLSLMRALQAVDCFHDFRIPREFDDLQIDKPPFELTGWIHYPDGASKGLDEYDPHARKVSWPGPRPGRLVRRLWKLTPDFEQRAWSLKNRPVFQSVVWGNDHDNRHRAEGSSGNSLIVDLDFLLKVLRRLGKDLIITVEMHRNNGESEKDAFRDYRHQFYTRLYVLRQDGKLHTLHRHRRLRPGAR